MNRIILTALSLVLVPFSLAQDTAAQDKFLGNIFTGQVDPLFAEYWEQITPENSGKWGSVEATRDKMLWSNLDAMFAYAEENDMPVKHHTFVWGQQEPKWIADLPPEEQRAEVEEWMEAFAERYPDVEMIDVVNEAQHDAPSFKDAIGGDGETGWDWMIWSFEKTRELFPDAVLLINDYNILCCEQDMAVYQEQIALLNERGLLDGIGVQAHGLKNVSPEMIQNGLDALAEFGLPIYISELDIDAYEDEDQLQLYQDIFPVLWDHPAVVGVTFWGYKAGDIFLNNADLINWFDEERPALEFILDYTGTDVATTDATDTEATDTGDAGESEDDTERGDDTTDTETDTDD